MYELIYDELGYERIMRYIALRQARKIGILWFLQSGSGWLSPLPAGDRSEAVPVPVAELRQMIDYWFPLVQPDESMTRRGVQSETYGASRTTYRRLNFL